MNLRASPAPLTAGEFELMEILWRLGEASVKQVWKHVEPERKLAYTTVMTVLDKMRRKGLVLQRKQGRAYFYQPALDRGRALGSVVDSVVRTYFGGSRAAFLQFLAGGDSPGDGPAQEPDASASQENARPDPEPERAARHPAPRRESDIDEFLL